jgi:sugar phosphate isomerase/epimerase
MRARLFSLLMALPGLVEAAPANPFFAMDTGTQGPPTAAASTVAQLGFTGMSFNAHNFPALIEPLKANAMKLYAVYFTTALEADKPALDAQPALRILIQKLRGSGSTLWLGIQKITREDVPLPRTDFPDALLAAKLSEIAAYAGEHGVHVSLYPHAGFHIERVEHALNLIRQVAQPNLGLTFNLCHWLKVEGPTDPAPLLSQTLPYLDLVTVNGADTGDTKSLPWSRLIQPIGHGDYDLTALLRTLHALEYRGPIGLQHYGIAGDWKEKLALSMTGWQALP